MASLPRICLKATRPSLVTRRAQVRPALRLNTYRPYRPLAFSRFYASRTVDETIEEIQDQYATAKDEFEIAQEETEKMSVYAEDDRRAAREELDKLNSLYDNATKDSGSGDEIKGRIGQRIRELDTAVKNMEEMAQNQD